MNNPSSATPTTPAQSTLAFDVDPTNPGQFFACCGLLELANCVNQEVLGWFKAGQFHLSGCDQQLIQNLLTCEVQPRVTTETTSSTTADDADQKEPPSPPVLLGAPFDLTLDWWTEEEATRSGFKTWSGGQTVIGFINGMRDRIKERTLDDASLLTDAHAISKPKPFYFDGRLSRLTAIDMGFSTEKFTASFSPAAELLTMIGLQRFRPMTIIAREQYGYCTWPQPLPVAIAAATAHGLIPQLINHQPMNHRYIFPLVKRTGGKYKAFGPANPDWRPHD